MLRPKLIAVLFIPLIAANGCKSGPDATTVSAQEAIEALRRVQAATQVGMTYDQYSGLVIEAKAKTEKGARLLPDGSLRNEISNAIGSYADGVTVWQMQLKDEPLYLRYEPGATILPKYSIQPMETASRGVAADHREALDIIWWTANVHVEKAALLLEGIK